MNVGEETAVELTEDEVMAALAAAAIKKLRDANNAPGGGYNAMIKEVKLNDKKEIVSAVVVVQRTK